MIWSFSLRYQLYLYVPLLTKPHPRSTTPQSDIVEYYDSKELTYQIWWTPHCVLCGTCECSSHRLCQHQTHGRSNTWQQGRGSTFVTHEVKLDATRSEQPSGKTTTHKCTLYPASYVAESAHITDTPTHSFNTTSFFPSHTCCPVMWPHTR